MEVFRAFGPAWDTFESGLGDRESIAAKCSREAMIASLASTYYSSLSSFTCQETGWPPPTLSANWGAAWDFARHEMACYSRRLKSLLKSERRGAGRAGVCPISVKLRAAASPKARRLTGFRARLALRLTPGLLQSSPRIMHGLRHFVVLLR